VGIERTAHAEGLDLLARSIDDAVWTNDLANGRVWWSEGCYRLLGYPAGSVQPGWEAWQVRVHPDDREAVMASIQSHLDSGVATWAEEYRVLLPDGTAKQVLDRGGVRRDAAGHPVFLAGIVRDVTREKASEARLREIAERFQRASLATQDGIWERDLSRSRVWWSVPCYALLGYLEGEVHPNDDAWAARIHPEDRDRVVVGLRSALDRRDHSWSDEYRLLLPGGGFRTVFDCGYLECDPGGRPVRMTGTLRDISDHRRTSQALQERERTLATLLGNIPGAVYRSTPEFRLTYASEGMLGLTGYSPEEFMQAGSMPITELVLQEDRERVAAEVGAAVAARRPFLLEFRIRTRSGEEKWVHNAGTGVYGPQRQPLAIEGLVTDITPLKRTREALRTGEARLRRIFDSEMVGMAFWRKDGTILAANDYYLRLVGSDRRDLEAGRVHWRDLTPPEYRPLDDRSFAELAERGVCTPYEKEYLRKDGTRVPVLLGASTFLGTSDEGVWWVLDLSERKRIEAQFQQAQKMESVGRLAGGIAHDFNNLLTAIFGHGDLAIKALPEGSPARADVAAIRSAALRAAELTQQLLAFSRKQVLTPRIIDLDGVVRGLESILRRTLGEDIRLRTRLASGAWPIRADRVQVGQAILNLVVNARDAMPGGGELDIETGCRDFTAQEELPPGLSPGPHAFVSVADTGAGMDAETLSHLFEPFFTTKEVGKGTGLGLSTTYGIVRQSGGTVEVRSAPGRGSRFTLWFPALPGAVSPPVPAPAEDTHLGGRGRILLVEDEVEVRRLLADLLVTHGYAVAEAEDGESALSLIRGGERFDLLVSDLVMPRLGGLDLLRQARRLRPGLPVLFMTGYADPVKLDQAVAESGAAILDKPFQPSVLLRRVREALHHPEGR
jgi:PAS domain S-box-containing protein